MKRVSIISEIFIFLLITVFLIFPPFFTPKITENDILFTWSFPWRQLGLCAFALVLYFFTKKTFCIKKGIFYPSALCLALLLLCALIIKLISLTKVSNVTEVFSGLSGYNYPKTPTAWIFCFITFGLSAVYEEIIYRFYFTDALCHIVFQDRPCPLPIQFFLEFLGLLAFAFAHLYLGIGAVINAAFAHFVLRTLYKKTGLIWNCILIHFVYNIISLILL